MTKKKKIVLFVVGMLLLFGLYNLFWYLGVMHTYGAYIEKVPKNAHGVYVKFDESQNITYNVKLPDYLHLTGNLGVSNKSGTVLLIWPSFFSEKFTYGIRVQDDTGAYEIYVDENMNPINGDKNQKEVIKKNWEEINKLYTNAKKIWF